MILENESCRVEITAAPVYRFGSAGNRPYDLHLYPGPRREDTATYAIQIDLGTQTRTIALTGSRHLYGTENCAVLEGDILTVLQNDAITQLRVTDGAVVRYVPLEDDGFNINYEIHRVGRDWLLFGELELTMLDADFQKKWSFMGNDIFASTTRENVFVLKADAICLYDFLDNYYELDYNGHLLQGP